MGGFFIYMIKASVCLILFYLFYSILLSKETFYRLNRVTLLLSIPLSFALPLLYTSPPKTQTIGTETTSLNTLMGEEFTSSTTPDAANIPVAILLCIYYAGVLLCIGRYLIIIYKLTRLIRNGRKEYNKLGHKLVILPQPITPFSWFGTIVLSEADYQKSHHEILLHEAAHVRKLHSWDLLLADFTTWVQWFNPAAWLLKHELQTIHEYEADNEVLQQGIDAKQYQLLLIKRAAGSKFYFVTNHFNHNKLNKRITMMLRKKSNRKATFKYLYVIPVALLSVTAFARPEVSQKLEPVASVESKHLLAMVTTTPQQSNTNVDFMPNGTVVIHQTKGDTTTTMEGKPLIILDGEKMSMQEFTALNLDNEKITSMTVLKSDEATKEYGHECVIIVSTKAEDKKENVQIKTINIPKDKESSAERRKSQTIKILKNDTSAISIQSSTPIKDVVYIINEKPASIEEMDRLTSDQIKSITVLKDAENLKVYNAENKEGVIVITLKDEEK